MNEIIFIVSMLAASALFSISIFSLINPDFEFFPPPSRNSWQYRAFWLLFRVMFIGLVVLSFTAYNPQPLLNSGFRFLVCLPLLLLGFGLAMYLTLKLGWENAHGEAKGLVVTGWYQYSRNPIYTTSFIGMLGWGMFVNYFSVYLLIALWAAIYILAPFIEERWLEKKYGKEFLIYKAKVPRFWGFPVKK